MLKIENLTVNYGKISALSEVSMHISRGEIVSLIGANGAGKSSTLMSICNTIYKEEGNIIYKEQNITDMSTSQIARLGISLVPEGRPIFPRMSVEENLILGAFANKSMTKEQIANAIEQQYEFFPRLKERRKQMGETLSGGEQQMLAIARGLIADPELIMFDEPSLGLAPIVTTEIFTMIEKIRDIGTTVLRIEQNANMALSISDRGYVIESGRITLSGLGQELLINEDVKKAYLGG